MSGNQIKLLNPEGFGGTDKLQSYIDKIQEIANIDLSNLTEQEKQEFNVLQVAEYADALKDVDETQAALLLSTQGLTNAQIAETLVAEEGSTEKAYQAMQEAGLLASKQKLTNVELQNILASQLGSEARAKEIMMSMGLAVALEGEEAQTVQLTTKKLQQAVTNEALTASEAQLLAMTTGVSMTLGAQATITMPAWIANMKAMIAATWAQVKATLAWMATNPVGWCMLAIGAIVSLITVISGINKAIDKARKKAIETGNTIHDELSKIRDDINSTQESVNELTDSYNRLRDGVNTLDNTNIKLNSEDYQEFLDTSNKLADLFPELIVGVDAYGNKIIALGENAEETNEILERLIENQKQDLASKADEGMPEVFKGLKAEAKNAKSEIRNLKNEIADIRNFTNALTNSFYSGGNRNISISELFYNGNYFNELEALKRTAELLNQEFGLNLSVETSNNLGIEDYYIDLVSLSNEQKGKIIQYLNDNSEFIVKGYTDSIENEIEKQKQEVNASYKNKVTDIISGLYNNNSYNKLTDAQQILVNKRISNIDYYKDRKDIGNDIEGYVEDNFIKPLLKLKDEDKEKVDQIYSELLSIDPDASLKENSDKVTEYMNQLCDLLGIEDQDGRYQLMISLGFDIQEDKDLLNRAKTIATGYKNGYINANRESNPEIKKNLEEEYKKIQDWGLEDYAEQIKNGTIQSVFGNVDMDKRTIITWSDELKKTYQDELASWDYNPEVGSIDTVLGASDRFGEDLNGNGWEVAFTPILPDGTFLSKDTVYDYINSILEEAYVDDGKITEDELIAIDAQGREIGNTFVQGIFAGIDDSQNYGNNGNWAETIGRLMHFSGVFGSIGLINKSYDSEVQRVREIDKYLEGLNEYELKLLFDSDEFSMAKTKEDVEKLLEELKKDANIPVNLNLSSFLSQNQELKQSLIQLSKTGKLDEESIKSYAEYDKMLELCGGDADKLLETLKEIAETSSTPFDSVNNLSNIQGGFDTLDKVFKDRLDGDNFVAPDLLSGLYDQFGDLAPFEDFISVMQDMSATADDVQESFDNLATAYIDANYPLADLTEKNIAWTKEALSSMGVTNVEIAAEERLKAAQQLRANAMNAITQSQIALNSAKRFGITTSEDLANATAEEIQQLINEVSAANGDVTALRQLLISKQNINATTIDTTSDVAELLNMATALGVTSGAAATLAEIEKNGTSGGMPTSVYNNLIEQLKSQMQSSLKNFNLSLPKYGYGGSKKSDSSSGSGGSGSETEKEYDWIAVMIQRIEEALARLKKIADNTFISWTKRNSALNQEISKTKEEITAQEAAYKRYMKLADEVGLSEEYKKKVINGELDVETIKDEELADKIDKFKELYEKAIECSDAIQDLNINLSEFAKQKFDNIQSEFESSMSVIEAQANIIDAKIKKVQAQGYFESEDYYNNLIGLEKKNNDSLKKEYDALKKSLEESVKSGAIEEGSETWEEMQKKILEVEKSIVESDTALIEFENTIRNLRWEKFDYMEERINQITQEADFLIELMSNKKLYDDNGKFNKEGLASAGLHGISYNTYMQQSLDYAKERAKIEEELAKDPNNKDLIERREELLKLQQESIKNAESEKQAIKSLVQEGINIHLNALQELIDKYKESLQSAKDLYDYQKQIKEQTTNISNLEKIILSYSGDDSEEARKKLQETQKALDDAKTELKETEWEHYLSQTDKLLTDLYDDYSEILNARLDNIDELIADVVDEVNDKGSEIYKAIKENASEVGYTITDDMKAIFNSNDSNNIINVFSKNFSMYASGVQSSLDAIKKKMGIVDAISILKIVDKNPGFNFKNYKTGGKNIIDDYVWTNDGGDEIVRTKDGAILTPASMVLNNKASNVLYDFANNPSEFLSGLDISSNIPAIIPKKTNNVSNQVDFSIQIDKVVSDNPESFANSLKNVIKNDSKARGLLQEVTIGCISGNNSLLKNKY